LLQGARAALVTVTQRAARDDARDVLAACRQSAAVAGQVGGGGGGGGGALLGEVALLVVVVGPAGNWHNIIINISTVYNSLFDKYFLTI